MIGFFWKGGLVSMLVLWSSLSPVEAQGEPFVVKSAAFSIDRDGHRTVTGQLVSGLPDGARISFWVSYHDHLIEAFRRGLEQKGGEIRIELGPCEKKLLSGTYVLHASFSAQEQHPLYRRFLEKKGIPATLSHESRFHLVMGSGQMSEEERKELDDRYREIYERGSLMTDEIEGEHGKALEARLAGSDDLTDWSTWHRGLTTRLKEFQKEYDLFKASYAILPEERMVYWCQTIFYHLPQVLDEWDRELSGRREDLREDEENGGGGDAFRLTPEDRIHHVRQSLKGLAVHLGEVESDEKTFTRLRYELGKMLAELEENRELEEDRRTAWYEEWSVRVSGLGRSLLVAKTAEQLYHDFSKLRRRALDLGKAFALTGEIEGYEEIKGLCPTDDPDESEKGDPEGD